MLFHNFVVFGYFSPEALLPLTSVLASAVGVFLLFGSTVFRLVRRALRVVTVGNRRAVTIPRPHFRPREVSVESLESTELSTSEESDSGESRGPERRTAR
jgi:hypothetical protein